MRYRELLEDVMLPYATDKMTPGWFFQHDNDPKHTSRIVKQWIADKKINVLDWPAQSPDLNPIEHLWEELDRRIRTENYSKADNLMTSLIEEWNRIPLDRLVKLVDSMPARCAAVINSKGYATKY